MLDRILKRWTYWLGKAIEVLMWACLFGLVAVLVLYLWREMQVALGGALILLGLTLALAVVDAWTGRE